ncbi:MAG: cell envelope integrity protein CreD [Candidatus Paceibacterota bacterium]|jgi:inner membrane protein
MENKERQSGIVGFAKSLTGQAILLGILVLLLLIPASMVQNVVWNRLSMQSRAVTDITEHWGQNQQVAGPILVIPVTRTVRETVAQKDGTQATVTRTIDDKVYFTPRTLAVTAKMETELRSRGIYNATVYTTQADLKGSFAEINTAKLASENNITRFDSAHAYVLFFITDRKGIQELSPVVAPDGKKYDLVSYSDTTIRVADVRQEKTISNGLMADMQMPVPMPRYASQTSSGEMGAITNGSILSAPFPMISQNGFIVTAPIELSAKFRGSETLHVTPIGKDFSFTLSGNGTPKFSGDFLPTERTTTGNDFNASWNILEINHGNQPVWLGSSGYQFTVGKSQVGVDLMTALSGYDKTRRAVDYSILFTTLTFAFILLVTFREKIRVHPFHYLLVGLALVLFYLFLLPLSEYIGFAGAYIVGAFAIIGLIAAFLKSVLGSLRHTKVIGLLLAFLYGYLYVILSLEEAALLVGSLGLFVILAALMYVTRNIARMEK